MESVSAKEKIFLPSPNGSTLVDLATRYEKPVFIGSLRNAGVLARILSDEKYFPVLLLAAGERFPNQMLRPCLEDYLGAGAILSELRGEITIEAQIALKTFEDVSSNLLSVLEETESGRELIMWGYGEDVRLAAMHNISSHASICINNQAHLSIESARFPSTF
jgi:2-phosphosulfolactate phosphatase